MALGTGVFLASLVFSAVLVIAITMDRWDWARALKRLALGALGLLVLSIAAIYGWNMFREAREESQQAKQAAQAKLAEEREAGARACVVTDLPRMEALAGEIKAAAKENMTLEDAQTALNVVTASYGQIDAPADDIRERVLIYTVPTQCKLSAFKLLVNLRADSKGTLRWLRVWAEGAPSGYQNGWHEELSTDFEARRRYEAEAAAAARAQRVAAEKQRVATNPCAPNLSREERLRRLAAYGELRQTKENIYQAGGRMVAFHLDGSLASCL